MFVRRCVDFERAESELIALMPSATYRQTDSFGRQLWRSGRPLQLRWVLGFENPGKPQVIWVGQGRPPDAHAASRRQASGSVAAVRHHCLDP